MEDFSTIYSKWRNLFLKVAFFIAASNLFIEIIMSALLIYQYPGMIKLDLPAYIAIYIILPSTINFTLAIAGKLALASHKLTDLTKNYISILIITGISFTMSCVHNVYAVLPCSLCFPIYISIMFSNKKITRDISIVSFFALCISSYFAAIDGRAGDKLIWINLIITIDLLIGSYFISAYLLKLEYEKTILLKNSYKKQSQLEEQLKYDPLTKLYNMSTFYSFMSRAIEKEEFPLSIAVIDVDNFKRVNDTYGHDNGNTVLIYLAQLLQEHCSAMGDVFRYGGEEFSVIFTNKSAAEALPILEDLQHIFAQHRFEFMDQGNITFSCGIAETNRIDCNTKELFSSADKAMYLAKSTGKNKTVIG